MTHFTNTLIELHVDDFQMVLDFYGTLGFKVVWAEEDYLTLSLGDATLCFYGGNADVSKHSYFSKFEADTKRGFGVEIVVIVEDLIKAHQEAERLGAVVTGLRERKWGARDFRIEDPFGYYLRFSEPYHAVDRKSQLGAVGDVLKKAGLEIKY